MTETFETRYGFNPGVNEVRFADDEARKAVRQYGGDSLAVQEMAALYNVIAEVSLPDVCNGYFIHPADTVMQHLEQHGYVFLPMADDPRLKSLGSLIEGDPLPVTLISRRRHAVAGDVR